MHRFFLFLLCLLPFGGVHAADFIPSFDARIEVFADATVRVQERIVYDFGSEERHGIFRVIPYSYQAQTTTYTAPISEIFVSDGKGEPLPFSESRGRGELTLKIGDPGSKVSGRKEYVITYMVKGPFLSFDGQDELYWNVTGVWQKPIKSASVLIDLPVGATVLDARCYQGGAGAVGACNESERLVSAERAGYRATAENLRTDEQMTIAIAFPKGTVAVPTVPKPKKQGIPWYAYLPILLPLCSLLLLSWLWYTRGRDPRGRGVVTQFAPPSGVSPAIAGIVYNERIEPREITAEIIRLAVEGYIRIHRLEKKLFIITTTEYLLERTEKEAPRDEVSAFILERIMSPEFQGVEFVEGREVYGAVLSKMQRKFASDRDAIINMLYQTVLDRGFFPERPDYVRKRYHGIGFASAILGSFAVWFLFGVEEMYGILAMVSVNLTGALCVGFGFFMPVKTREGVHMQEVLEGFKRYLSVAEKDRLAFHNAPERTPELFDTYLPYAIAFGVESAWAEQFEGIYQHEPSWYSGTGTAFNGAMFAKEMQRFGSDFTSASMPVSSGAGGGGHAGGGFGGGRGGSW